MKIILITIVSILTFQISSQSISLSLGAEQHSFIKPGSNHPKYFYYNFEPSYYLALGYEYISPKYYPLVGFDLSFSSVKGSVSNGSMSPGGSSGRYAIYDFDIIGLRVWLGKIHIYNNINVTYGAQYKFTINNKSLGGSSYFTIGPLGGGTREDIKIVRNHGVNAKIDYEYRFDKYFAILPSVILYIGTFNDYSYPSFTKSFSLTIRRYFNQSNP